MKVLFSLPIRHGFISALKLLYRENKSAGLLSYASVATSLATSSEDEDLTPDKFSASKLTRLYKYPSAEFDARSNKNPASTNCNNCKYPSDVNSVTNYKKIDDTERIKSILMKHGWNFEGGTDFSEEKVIKALNGLFSESDDAALALQFFRWLESSVGLKLTVRSVCTMIRILLLGNMNYRAMDLLLCLIRNHHGEDKKHDLLLNTIQEICEGGSVLETVCSMLVKCYVEEGTIEIGIRVVCQMEILGIFPSAGVCNMLIRSLLMTNKMELACNLLEEMHRRGMVNVSTVSLFICYYCRKGEVQRGWKLLIDMKNYGIRPDFVAFTIVIDSLCKQSHVEVAASLLFKMIQMGILPDQVLLSSIIDGFCKAGMPDKAIYIANFFNASHNKFAYNSLISKSCRDGDMVKASDIFQEMSDLGIRPDCFSYSTLIDGYLRVKDLKTSLKYVGKMFKSGFKPSVATYTMLIRSYCVSGDIEMSESLLHMMLKEGLRPDIMAYNTLINGYGRNSQLQEAFKLLDLMTSAGISPDIVTYNSILHSLIMTGFVNVAKDILNEIIRTGISPDVVTFTNVIVGFSIKGQLRKALAVWSSMSEFNLKPDVITCTGPLNGYCKAGCMEEASALFDKVLAAGLTPDIILYNLMIRGFCSVGKIEEARRLIYMMLEQNIIPNDVTYKALIHGFRKTFVKYPLCSAAVELKQILQKHGLKFHVDLRK